jgi:tetratricopeptide (TPR) repeat protein
MKDMRLLIPLLMVAAGFGQQPAPTCAEVEANFARPIDEFITEIKKQERKRFKNPLPNSICVFGFCTQTGAGPDGKPNPPTPPLPPPPKRAEVPPGTSSSRETQVPDATPPPQARCVAAEQDVIAIAKNVDTADFYFKEKNYRAALSRYKEADGQKPNDPAIHLRLGRAYEKLEQREEARKHYKAAAEAREGFWTAEAKAALERVK